MVVPESELVQTEHGLVPKGQGWFVVNARETQWWERQGRGVLCEFEGAGFDGATDFDVSVSVGAAGAASVVSIVPVAGVPTLSSINVTRCSKSFVVAVVLVRGVRSFGSRCSFALSWVFVCVHSGMRNTTCCGVPRS